MSAFNKKARHATPVLDNLSDTEMVEMYRDLHNQSQPYTHSVLYPLINPDNMRMIHDEAKNNMRATFKETDLFKVYQTADFGNLQEGDELANKMPELMKLRSRIYSREFRNMVQTITGCADLTDRTDLSMNAYATSCHLMCHDDVIATRCISFIIYLTDPDEEWTAQDGGALELYPLDESQGITTINGAPQGVPAALPTKNILPTFNSMAFFAVQPGRSYHAVQEVFVEDKPRLSISGWFHAESPPVGSDMASLSQIMSKGDNSIPFEPIPADTFPAEEEGESEVFLSSEDKATLSPYINPIYLQKKSMKQINDSFLNDSSIQLYKFLKEDVAASLGDKLTNVDELDKLGNKRVPSAYTVGMCDGWEVKGPPHKQRFVTFAPTLNVPDAFASPHAAAGHALQDIVSSVLKSPAFLRYLKAITNLKVTSSRHEVRRFRAGIDYTVAHHGTMVETPMLDATLCFVKADDADDEEAELWESGDAGGFECYIEADEDADAAATAEVYRSSNEDDESELMSIQAGNNVLNIVMRDTGVMRFIKYVSARAPSSRWDVSMEYELEALSEEEEEEEEEEEGGNC
jgi:prolyl 3-hydroxylase /prolyl 3,4-dihydroxylase